MDKKANPKLPRKRNLPTNISSTPTIHDHLKICSAVITDISAHSKNIQIIAIFSIYDSNAATSQCKGPNNLQVEESCQIRFKTRPSNFGAKKSEYNSKLTINMIWHIISDPRDIDFFCLRKKPKVCKIQDAQKCQPRSEFGI